MKKIFLLVLLLSSASSYGEELGIHYLKNIFGHIHKNQSRSSSSMTTLACGHPIKIIESKKLVKGWVKVGYSDFVGYMLMDTLSAKRPDCLQGRYPKFFDLLNLDVSDMYYWGRLYDQYSEGQSYAK